jgi:hypothetical protein
MAALQALAPRADAETLTAYGYRIVSFLIGTEITGTLSTEDLQLAQHTIVAIYGQKPSDHLIANLRAVERILSAVLAFRALQPADSATAGGSGRPADRPTIGPMAPLSPVPDTRPPAPAKVRPAIAF